MTKFAGMQARIYLKLVSAFFLFSISGCKKDSLCNCFQSTGNQSSEKRPLTVFNSIDLSNNVDVTFHSSSEYMATVTCGDNLTDGIRTEVKSGTLFISNVNRCNWVRKPNVRFKVDVYAPAIDNIIYRGFGDFTCSDTIRTSRFLAESWDGTGTVDLKLHCSETYLKIHTGPADIHASGITGYAYYYNTGNGFMRCNDLESPTSFIFSRSTGDCEINASQSLQAIIRYNGNVYFSGNPAIITQEITGQGRLIPQ